ncbi:MAG: hypothetical protein ABSE81_00585 [Candidatus Omnitrophota bacterium]|jgi:uncharacterized membrane protein
MKKIKTGFMLIEFLLVLVIIMFVVFKVWDIYFKKPALNKETQKVMTEQGVDTTNYKTISDSIKNKVEDIQSQHINELMKIQ